MNIGDYVRTKYGITQYKEYETANGNKLLCMPVKDGSNGIFANIEDIIKSSSNIIDLIEVGDYVNGKKVEWIGYDLYRENEDKTLTGIGEKRILFNEFTNDSVREKGIKSILTKEQFKRMEYKVEDKE